jgi:natural product biosynthesis luciferase-like monooxygenase protein
VTATLHRRLSLLFRYNPHQLPSTLVAQAADVLAGLIASMLTQPDHNLGTLLKAAQRARQGPAVEPRIQPGSGFGPAEIEVVLAQHRFVSHVSASPGGPDGSLAVHIVPTPEALPARTRPMALSLFYFADASTDSDKYRLYLEGAKFADRNGFAAIWTPERHFHENGGLYPNPSVLSAALATITERVQLRAGSVVLPLHHPLRIAEEWSVVDNLSRGRVAIAAASGWVPNDFVFTPGIYERRRDVMFELIDKVQRLWRGEALQVQDGVGNDTELRIFPRPVQPELPIWLTCAGNPDTFEQAGLRGHNVLTSMLAQSLDDATTKIARFRRARERAGHNPDTGIATMMLHTFLGGEHDRVIDIVREPFTRYLRSHVSLMQTLVKSLDMQIDINEPAWLDYLASFAFERYQRTSALIGTPVSCVEMVDRLSAAGVDELACLIDFGVGADEVLAGLEHLAELKRLVEHRTLYVERVLAEHVAQRLPFRLPPLRFHIAAA